MMNRLGIHSFVWTSGQTQAGLEEALEKSAAAGFRLIDAARSSKGHLPMTHGECVVIEDAPPGVAAGRGADLHVLGVTNTVSAEELRAAGAQVVTKDLDDWMPETFRRVFV